MTYNETAQSRTQLHLIDNLTNTFINILDNIELTDSVNICPFLKNSNTFSFFCMWFSTSNVENHWKWYTLLNKIQWLTKTTT